MNRFLISVFVMLAACALISAACDDGETSDDKKDDETTDGGGKSDKDNDGDGDTDAGSDEEDAGSDEDAGFIGPKLDESHDSYGSDPRCWECHEEDAHSKGLNPHQCAGCHGTNGAGKGHERPTTPCSNCHNPPPHGEEGFPDPESCLICHPG